MSDHPDTALPSTAPTRRVRVAILAVDDQHLTATLTAIGRQVYGVESITIVDRDGDLAQAVECEVVGDFATFVAGLEADTDLVWILHGDAEPRPDALGALVAEMDRNDASLVGSKIIDAAVPDRLESVGSATDVFGEPYTGLDPDEVDLEQYDVVRDVAFVSAVSMLVRRDLLRGLRGIDPLLAPVAAGMDFSQRARVAGGRVMVTPSSEVLHHRTCRDEVAGWRETAGRMRSMLKAYRFITLAWVVPVGTVLGLVDGILRLLLGTSRPLFDFIRATLWNVAKLPGSLAARNAVRAVRQVGDEELFRYQVSGSVRTRLLVNDIAERFGWVIDDEPGVVTEEELDDEASATGAVVAALGLVVLGLATRSFLAGSPPQAGYSFRIVDPVGTLASFAGGWNSAGLGSPEPAHPSAAFFSVFEWLTRGWGGAFPLVVAALLVAAFLGAGKLLSELGVTGPTRHLAGVVALVGVSSSFFAGDADLSGWLAIGPVLWTLVLVVMPWPSTSLARVGRLGGVTVSAATAAMLSPLSPVTIFFVAVVLWLVVPGLRVGVAARGLLAADIGLLAVAPYLVASTPAILSRTGPTYQVLLQPGPGVLVATAVLFGVAFLPGRRHRLAAAGGLLLAIAAWVGIAETVRGDFGAAVALLAVVGLVMVVGSTVGIEREASRLVLGGRVVASMAAVGLLALSLVHVLDGRAGFPPDEWSDRLEFTTRIGSQSDAARVLLVGSADDLPGSVRGVDQVTYRLVDIAGPGLESARLGTERLGDEALGSLVAAIAGGQLVRPGEALAEFGIGWVAVIDDLSFTGAMSAQVDMDELAVREDLTVFRNTVAAPRAIADSGAVWNGVGTDLIGPSGPGTVRIADNASAGWSPGWQQDDWANRVSAADGVATYRPVEVRRSLAWVTVALFVLGAAALPFSRRVGR